MKSWRSADLWVIYRETNLRFLLPVLMLNYQKLYHFTFFYCLHYNNLLSSKLKLQGVRSWGLKPQSFLEHPVHYPEISRSSTFHFCWQSVCLIFKSIYECFLPKSNLRPVLWSYRSPLGLQKFNNMLTAALFLMPNQIDHPVVHFEHWYWSLLNIDIDIICIFHSEKTVRGNGRDVNKELSVFDSQGTEYYLRRRWRVRSQGW